MGVSRYMNRIFVVSVIVDKGRFRIGIGRNIDCSADAVAPEIFFGNDISGRGIRIRFIP